MMINKVGLPTKLKRYQKCDKSHLIDYSVFIPDFR